MAGGGNDFVMIDNRSGHLRDIEELTRRICTRRLSVGADGIILIEPSSRASFRMRYFNADGSLAMFCGNGTRCAARYAWLKEIAPREMTIETGYGIIPAIVDDSTVTISLPPPQNFRAERALRLRDGSMLQGSSLMVGVPHFVTFVRDGLWTMDVRTPGAEVRWHPELKPDGGANANFVLVNGRHTIEVRTFERGVEDETLSCGSGVVASSITSAMFERVDPPVGVRTRGGITLTVDFVRRDGFIDEVTLSGDARVIYESRLTPETLEGFDPVWARQPTEVTSGT